MRLQTPSSRLLVLAASVLFGTMGTAQAADLAIVKTGGGAAAHNATVTFTLNVSNAGGLTLMIGNPVTVTDAVPLLFDQVTANGPGWTCPNVPSTNIVTCTRSSFLGPFGAYPAITITARAHNNGSYTNTAHVSFVANAATQPDQVLGNNSSAVSGTIAPGYDVKIHKTASGGTHHIGGALTFTLHPYNVGTASISSLPANQVTVTDTLPTGFVLTGSASNASWSCAPASGTAVLITCTYIGSATIGPLTPFPVITVPTKPTISGTYTNTAHIQPNLGPDSNTSNNTHGVTVTVVP